MTEWQNRIIAHGEKPADEFNPNPRNPRTHPEKQRQAMRGSLNALGWIAPVIVNKTTGHMIDGHERIAQALSNGNAMVACEQLGRQCRMIEIEPKYVAVILERMSQMGLQPELTTDTN